MSAQPLLDAAGRPQSPATLPGHHAGRIPRNKGRRYPADPPTIDEIVAVMRQAGEGRHGRRMGAWSSCCGGRVFVSMRRSRSPRLISSAAAAC